MHFTDRIKAAANKRATGTLVREERKAGETCLQGCLIAPWLGISIWRGVYAARGEARRHLWSGSVGRRLRLRKRQCRVAEWLGKGCARSEAESGRIPLPSQGLGWTCCWSPQRGGSEGGPAAALLCAPSPLKSLIHGGWRTLAPSERLASLAGRL